MKKLYLAVPEPLFEKIKAKSENCPTLNACVVGLIAKGLEA